ncbi:MAG: hypothetical protein FJ096_03140 [Deltaproteobacteria bacterium]|nr:hypothetical protein [Deltaproteobacteria bacterium]
MATRARDGAGLPRALGFAVVVRVLVGALGCEARGPATHGFACTCDALTDTDQATEVVVAVCLEAPTNPEEVARGQASTVGRMPVSRCRCAPTPSCEGR